MRFRDATVLIALLPTVVSGCSRSSAARTTTLNIWSGPKGTEERAFNKLCRRFEHEHPGIIVRNLGSLLEDKLIRAIVAGAPPDLAYLYGTSDLGPLAANGALTELDGYYAASGLTDDVFLPGIIRQHRYAGRLYAMPVTRDSHGLYWNKEDFRKAGLDPDRPPRTMGELRTMANKLTLRRPDGSLAQLGFYPFPDDQAMLLTAYGGTLFDEKTGRITINSRESVEALQQVVDLVDSMGGRSSMAAVKASLGAPDTEQNYLATGRVAMSMEGEWFGMYLEKHAPKMEYGIGEVPYPAAHPELRNLAWQDGDIFIVPKGARHLPEAWKFIRWMQEPHQQEEYAAAMNNLPSIRALMSSPAITTGSKRRETLGYILKHIAAISPNSQFFPTLPVSRFYRDVLNNAIEAAELHKKTPQQALDDVQRRVEREMRKYR